MGFLEAKIKEEKTRFKYQLLAWLLEERQLQA